MAGTSGIMLAETALLSLGCLSPRPKASVCACNDDVFEDKEEHLLSRLRLLMSQPVGNGAEIVAPPEGVSTDARLVFELFFFFFFVPATSHPTSALADVF